MATNYYVKSGAGAIDYNAARAYVTGEKIVPTLADVTSNVATARKWVWECTTAGTTNAAPTWPAAVTQDVTTFTVNGTVFTARKPGFSSGSTANWAFATIYLQYGVAAATAAGDVVYVSNNHAEVVAGPYTIANSNGTVVQCVDDSAAPPTANAVTATVTTNSGGNLTIGSVLSYVYGIKFSTGSGSAATANFVTTGIFEKCQFKILGTGSGSVHQVTTLSEWINCDVMFGAAGNTLTAPTSRWRWTGGSLLAGGTSPTALIGTVPSFGVIEDVDLSNAAAAMNLTNDGTNTNRQVYFRNCKLPASWSGVLNSSVPVGVTICEMNNCDNAGTNYRLNRKVQYGTVVDETTIIRTGGANNGVTGISWKLVSTAAAVTFPLQYVWTPEIVMWNSTTGSAITVTVEIVSSVTLTDKECWLELSYLSASGAPLGALITSAAASPLASAANIPTSTAPWGSSPSTPVYQKMSVTLTPNLKGFLHATVKLCRASTTIYVDPMLTVAGVTSSAQRQIPGGMFVNEISAGAAGGVVMSRVHTGA